MILLPNPPPVYSLMRTTLSGLHVQPARDGRQRSARCSACPCERRPCRSASTPSRCAAPGIWWLVSGVTKVSSRTRAAFLKPASTIAVTSTRRCALPMGKRPCLSSAKSASVHFSSLDLRWRRPAAFSGLEAEPAPRTQTLPSARGFGPPGRRVSSGSMTNGKRFEIDLDFFDGLGGGQFVHGRHRQNRLALVQRLVGERPLALLVGLDHGAVVGQAVGRRGKIVRGKNRFHAGHGQRLARVDVLHARRAASG